MTVRGVPSHVTTLFVIDFDRISFSVLIHLSPTIRSSHSQLLSIATNDFALNSGHPTLATLSSPIGRFPPELLIYDKIEQWWGEDRPIRLYLEKMVNGSASVLWTETIPGRPERVA
jgi:hypothetical protein